MILLHCRIIIVLFADARIFTIGTLLAKLEANGLIASTALFEVQDCALQTGHVKQSNHFVCNFAKCVPILTRGQSNLTKGRNRRPKDPCPKCFDKARSRCLEIAVVALIHICLLYTSPSPRDGLLSRMPSSA